MTNLNLRHPLGRITALLLFLFSAILWTSCDKKEEDLSSENLIVRLSLKDADKEYAAKVSSSSGALSVELPLGSALPTEVTISLLELSLKARASTSVNSKVTLAEGRATITVTAENKVTKQYTLIVTVKKSAAADLKSLSVSIGGKSYTATLSTSLASVSLPANVAIPTSVTVASLEVSLKARASISANSTLTLVGGRATITVTAEDGTTTRSYILEVSKEAANQANLFALSIRFGQTAYEAVISGDMATFSQVPRSFTSGTITVINISEGAESSVTVGQALSFTSGEGQLIVTASDGQTRKTIAVKLEGAALSTEAELSALSLMIGGTTYTATISGTVATVLSPQVVTSASVASLSYATGATSSVQQGGLLTFAGGTSTITITAADGKTTKTYQIVLAKEGDFLTSFSFQVADNSYTSPYSALTTSLGKIDLTAGTIEVELSPYLRGVELASLVPSFTTIEDATVVVGTATQESGKTPNDFSTPVTYRISSGGTTQQYIVNVKLSRLAWIPDANFRAKLKDALPAAAFSTNDSLWTDHSSVTGLSEMRVESSSIRFMIGLEFFTGLTGLYCNSNQLTSVDVSKNIALTNLSCSSNDLRSLDVSKNIALTNLSCSSNQLTVLDVSKNIALTELNCSSNQLTVLDVSKNIALAEFNCSSNQLTALDVSKNIALATLDCSSNQLTDLGRSSNIALTQLDCSSNQLTSLHLHAQPSWTALSINAGETLNDVVQNPLTTLHIHDDAKDHAEVLEAKTNRVDALTIPTYSTAGDVVCEDYDPINQSCAGGFFLTSFSIDLASNNMVTTHTGRTSLVGQIDHASDPKTVTVFVSPYEEGANLTSLKASFEVQSGATVMVGGVAQTSGVTPNNFSAPVTYSVSSGAATQEYTISVKTTNLAWIPDPNFRAKLKDIQPLALAFTQNDSLITDHSNVTGLTEMRVESSNIDSMTGLEFFTGLTTLACNSNDLTTLDVSKNIALTYLACSSNDLTSLDVSKNIALTYLACSSNDLANLDVSKNIALSELYCYSNPLTNLDVTKNIALTNLNCNSNQLTSLDVSKNIALVSLYCYSNDLTNLDVTKNIALIEFNCSSNQLTSLDLRAQQSWLALRINAGETADGVLQNPLTTLHVHEAVKDHAEFIESKTNRVDALTISTYTTAGAVVCEDYNPITTTCSYPLISFSIELASNNLVTTHTGRTNLVGQIDHASATKTVTVFVSPYEKGVDLNTPLKASFEVKNGATVMVGAVAQISGVTPNNFSAPVTYSVSSGGTTREYTVNVKTTNLAWIPDPNFRAKLKDVQPLAGAFTQNDSLIANHGSVRGLTKMDVSNSNIDSMTGLEFFTGLTDLRCYTNNLTALDLTKNIALTGLDCSSNSLTTLDVSKHIALTKIFCSSNDLTVLDVSKNTALSDLRCYTNNLTDLDVSKNTALAYLFGSTNDLTVLDVSKNTALAYLDCASNDLTVLDLSKNTVLVDLSCYSNNLTTLDLRVQQSWTTLRIDAGVTRSGVAQNSLTTLHVHEDVKDHEEFIEAKTNRVNALTISTYNTAGGTACNNYDPRQSSRGCKD